MVYANGALEILAYDYWKRLKTPKGEKVEINWIEFWDICLKDELFFLAK